MMYMYFIKVLILGNHHLIEQMSYQDSELLCVEFPLQFLIWGLYDGQILTVSGLL